MEVSDDYMWEEMWWGADNCDGCAKAVYDGDLVLTGGKYDGECYCEECAEGA